jgi:hypothetical protein
MAVPERTKDRRLQKQREGMAKDVEHTTPQDGVFLNTPTDLQSVADSGTKAYLVADAPQSSNVVQFKQRDAA